jgi:hypothetical protein
LILRQRFGGEGVVWGIYTVRRKADIHGMYDMTRHGRHSMGQILNLTMHHILLLNSYVAFSSLEVVIFGVQSYTAVLLLFPNGNVSLDAPNKTRIG